MYEIICDTWDVDIRKKGNIYQVVSIFMKKIFVCNNFGVACDK